MKTIAFFDFDGTLTRQDTLIDFTRYAFGNLRFTIGIFFLAPIFGLLFLRLLNRDQVARRFIRYFYSGEDKELLAQKAYGYVAHRIPELINPQVYDAFRSHRKKNDSVVIVSASPEIWLIPWCKGHGADLIATRLKSGNGIFTGEVTGKRCIGKEKVIRIQEQYNLSAYDTVYAYGNSDGDIAMLEAADHAYFVKKSVLGKYTGKKVSKHL